MTDLVRVPAALPDDPVDSIQPLTEAERDAFGFLRAAIETLSGLVEANPSDIHGLARTQLLSQKIKRELDLLIEQIRPHLLDCMGDAKQIDLEGVGRLERKSGVNHSKWDHDDVQHMVRIEARRRCVSEEGELCGVLDAVDRTLDLVWAVVSRGSYKKTGLREQLGISADEVSKVSFGNRQVIITGASK